MSYIKPLSGIKAPDNRHRYHGSPPLRGNGEHHDDGGYTFLDCVTHIISILNVLLTFSFLVHLLRSQVGESSMYQWQ